MESAILKEDIHVKRTFRKKPITASTKTAEQQALLVKSLMKQLFNAMDELNSMDSELFDEMDLTSLYNDLDITIRENA